ncbi:SDR family NAD(P)-dependent oxidoreductase [Roseobacter denitrificans]|uniref:Oxidoreductase, putative n=1 Tax=Roseobacter denitrificans (strain ATCC 33942 / OCh 114) TaxID=375451 RepID=Q163M3_ROSDO|nr:SDR family oxidoreductase [Roseobacter denitrificans]ABG32820.1 oxidoreductase, putative [Roseobacter denitrificans OCh 114]AVL52221.1 SDR family NAD(P)-dependent oxidoreductase [Roseobacter denitrificans]SFF95348.1 NADP-dependent 3-hydroxy acid dehydrogenase YdfG [Roseobacter denitrificans OCh 114]
MTLANAHALVTGGGTGIGLAIAKDLAAAGAQVTITGRRQEVLDAVAAQTPGLHGMAMDVRAQADVIATTERAVAARGPIQICIANAGIAEGRALHKTDLDFWRNMMATNLDGTFLTIREALKTMRGAPWGRVIAVSSIAGLRGLQGASCYTASKHGMIGLIRGLSEDYLGKPITFNALCPAYVDTEIITRNTDSIAARAGVSTQEARDIMVSANRHNRLIAPEEVSAAAMWLVSEAAASVNGQAIEIAGGQM